MVKVTKLISALIPIFLTLSSTVAQSPEPTEVVVSGLVLNSATAQPLPNVPLRLLRLPDAEPIYTKATAQGRFEFRGLPPGRYIVEARLPGFVRPGESPSSPTGPVLLNLETAAPLSTSAPFTKTLEPGGVLRGEVNVPLTPQAVLTGRITDPDGLPQPDIRVEILALREPPPGIASVAPTVNGRLMTNARSATTDDQGEYRAAALPAGTYVVRVSVQSMRFNQDPSFRTTFYPRAADPAAAQSIQLAAGQQARADIQIIRQAGVTISGRLVLPSSSPPEPNTHRYTHLLVIPKPPNGPPQESRPGQAQGNRYEAADLVPGAYELTAVTYQISTTTPTQQTPMFAASRTVQIGSSDLTGPDLDLRPLPRLEAALHLGEGCPDSGVQLGLSGMQGMPSAIQVQPGQTRVALPPLLPGYQRLQLAGSNGAQLPIRSLKVQVGDLPPQDYGFDTPTQDGTPIRIDVVCIQMGGVR